MDTEEAKLYNEGVERYPTSRVVWQNLFFVIWFGAGFVGMLPLQILGFPIVSALYALFLVVTLLFVLRKHLCTHCYYYGRMCNTGWGRLSAAMFKKGSGNYRFGVRFAGITWMFATIAPIVGTVVALVVAFSTLSLVSLIVFIVLMPINFASHKDACKRCKMRFICPMSMAKGDSGKDVEGTDAEG